MEDTFFLKTVATVRFEDYAQYTKRWYLSVGGKDIQTGTIYVDRYSKSRKFGVDVHLSMPGTAFTIEFNTFLPATTWLQDLVTEACEAQNALQEEKVTEALPPA